MNFAKELEKLNKKLGATPRTFSLYDRVFTIKCSPPAWDWSNDPLSATILRWENLFKHGKIGWGNIIQVNSLLFEKGKYDHPGELLVSTGNTTPEEMRAMCMGLYELKGNSAEITDPETKEFAEHLENEMTRVFGLKVPETIANDNDCFISSVFFQRNHLPNKKITNGFFPVFYSEQDPKIVIVIPSKFWSKEFLKWWKEDYL